MPLRPCVAGCDAFPRRRPQRATRFPCAWAWGRVCAIDPLRASPVENSLTSLSDYSAHAHAHRAKLPTALTCCDFALATQKGVDAGGAIETESLTRPVNAGRSTRGTRCASQPPGGIPRERCHPPFFRSVV